MYAEMFCFDVAGHIVSILFDLTYTLLNNVGVKNMVGSPQPKMQGCPIFPLLLGAFGVARDCLHKHWATLRM